MDLTNISTPPPLPQNFFQPENKLFSKKNILALVLVGILLLTIPFIVTYLKQTQILKSRATADIIFEGEGVSGCDSGDCQTTSSTVSVRLQSPLGPPAPASSLCTTPGEFNPTTCSQCVNGTWSRECTNYGNSDTNLTAWCSCAQKCVGKQSTFGDKPYNAINFPQCTPLISPTQPAATNTPSASPSPGGPTTTLTLSKTSGLINGETITLDFAASGGTINAIHTSIWPNITDQSQKSGGGNYQGISGANGSRTATVPFYVEWTAVGSLGREPTKSLLVKP